MNPQRVVAVAGGVGLLAGVVGALLVAGLRAPDAGRSDASTGVSAVEALEARVRAVEDQNRVLRLRLDSAAERPVAVTRVPDDLPTRAEFEALAAELRGGSTLDPDLLLAPPADWQAAVDQVLAHREEQARIEKQQAERDRRAARVREQVDDWTGRLDLTPYQAEQMSALLITREEAQTEVKLAVGSGTLSKADAGQSWQQIEADFQGGLVATLTPTQWESYQQQLATRGKDG